MFVVVEYVYVYLSELFDCFSSNLVHEQYLYALLKRINTCNIIFRNDSTYHIDIVNQTIQLYNNIVYLFRTQFVDMYHDYCKDWKNMPDLMSVLSQLV